MRAIFLGAILLGWGLLSPPADAQSVPATFPLAGDWEGVWVFQGTADHLVLHMNTTPEGRMTALMDFIDLKISGVPPISGSFDGSRLKLRFTYGKLNGNGDLVNRVASYEATVNESTSEMTGVWTQEGSWPLNFKRVTWHAKVPKPAPPTIFDGDWAGVENEGGGLKIHLIYHIRNTEDGLTVLFDCPEEKIKGALASKVSFDQASRQFSVTIGQAIWAGKMTADGKALETSVTEPGFHFLVHCDRLAPEETKPN